jgi:hypothetical protein
MYKYVYIYLNICIYIGGRGNRSPIYRLVYGGENAIYNGTIHMYRYIYVYICVCIYISVYQYLYAYEYICIYT